MIYYQGIGHMLRTICKEEGAIGLYKGLGATLLVLSIFRSYGVVEDVQ